MWATAPGAAAARDMQLPGEVRQLNTLWALWLPCCVSCLSCIFGSPGRREGPAQSRSSDCQAVNLDFWGPKSLLCPLPNTEPLQRVITQLSLGSASAQGSRFRNRTGCSTCRVLFSDTPVPVPAPASSPPMSRRPREGARGQWVEGLFRGSLPGCYESASFCCSLPSCFPVTFPLFVLSLPR